MKIAVIGTDEDEKGIQDLRAFAERPENLYDLSGEDAEGLRTRTPPGDDPRFRRFFRYVVTNPNVGNLQGVLRVVFTITKMANGTFRHASFSLVTGDGRPGIDVTGEGRDRGDLPSPSAVEAVCYLLGFTGGFGSWVFGAHEHDGGVIVVAQRVDRSPLHAA